MAAVLAVGGAFLVSSRFLGHARAQEEGGAPPAAEAPPIEPVAPPPMPAEAAPPPPPDAATPPNPADAQPMQAQPYTPPGSTPGGYASDPSTNTGIAELEGFLEPFIYDIVNRRDPFQAYAEYVPADDSGGPPRALSPAQRWELEQLKLIGIMWDIKDPKAMFLDPEEEVMILGRDESIGNRNGYIAAIREGEVVVVEAIRKRGDIIYRTRVLRIER